MADNNSSAPRRGLGFGGALAIVFIALKLTGHITWSWWWVLSPLWIPVCIVLLLFAIVGMAATREAKRRQGRPRY